MGRKGGVSGIGSDEDEDEEELESAERVERAESIDRRWRSIAVASWSIVFCFLSGVGRGPAGVDRIKEVRQASRRCRPVVCALANGR